MILKINKNKMKKQTSVDFLIEEFSAIFGKVNFTAMQGLLMKDAVEKAKEMEKEQIKEAYMSALPYGLEYSHYDKYANKYYNEIYKKEDK
jgi:hypothetical protein